MKSLVLSIERCSIYDGPGIRTTVFLKGCPLRCKWCHNPESQSFKKQLRYYGAKCTKCGACKQVCKTQVHQLAEGTHTLDFKACTGCGACVKACSQRALALEGMEMTVEEVMAVIKEDMAFYKKSKGGVTISGGEPLSHVAFTKELLQACGKAGIHRCIETSGFGKLEDMALLAEDVDLFLFDYKITSEETHKHYTGVAKSTILQNLAYLMAQGKKVRLRCPIIPGMNDTKEHLDGILELNRKYPQLEGIELMPYHKIGLSKAHQVGMIQGSYEEPTSEQKREWQAYLEKQGCKIN
ncbi:MAG: glycyl-radical enzyme activating protein [Cellulosilyticaceae bacterium]